MDDLSHQQISEIYSESPELIIQIMKNRFQIIIDEKIKKVNNQQQYIELILWIKSAIATKEQKIKALEQMNTISSVSDKFKKMINQLNNDGKDFKIFDLPSSIQRKIKEKTPQYPNQNLDLDSIAIFFKVQGLPLLLGNRSSLSSSTQYLRDHVFGDYCNLLDGPFIVQIPSIKKRIVSKKLLEQNIQFSESKQDQKRIATQRVWVNTCKLVQNLKSIGIMHVRVIAHGLKDEYSDSFPWDNFLFYDPTNRFDFAKTIKNQDFQLYNQFGQYQVEVFPLFGTDSGTLKFQKEGNTVKIYNTFIHALKGRAKLNFFISQSMTYKQLRLIIEKIRKYLNSAKKNLPTSTRIQITVNQKAGQKYKQIKQNAVQQLLSIQRSLQPSLFVTKNQYIFRLEEFLFNNPNSFDGQNNKTIRKQSLTKLKELYKLLGISVHSKRYRNEQNILFTNKEKKIMKRDKKGRFLKNNKQ